MQELTAVGTEHGDEPCADVRSQAEAPCAEATRLKVAARQATVTLQAARRDLAQATAELEDADAAGDANRTADAKVAARAVYRDTHDIAVTELERQRAVTAWLREIDRINVRSGRADEMLTRAHTNVVKSRHAAEEAGRVADARRIRAEVAAHDCLEARQRQAICEEQTGATLMAGAVEALLVVDAHHGDGEEGEDRTGPAGPSAEEHRPEPGVLRFVEPLLAELLFEGDRTVMAWLARELSELTGHPPSHFLLLLQELLDAVEMAAADRQFLEFDAENPVWGQFSKNECRTIAHALSDLGFRTDPRDGWRDGRVPSAKEFAIAIAYAGFDVRRFRGMPTSSQGFRDLPSGIRASRIDLVRELAPELTIRQLVEVLGPRADALDDLWDDWGRLRPLLLTEARTLMEPGSVL